MGRDTDVPDGDDGFLLEGFREDPRLSSTIMRGERPNHMQDLEFPERGPMRDPTVFLQRRRTGTFDTSKSRRRDKSCKYSCLFLGTDKRDKRFPIYALGNTAGNMVDPFAQ